MIDERWRAPNQRRPAGARRAIDAGERMGWRVGGPLLAIAMALAIGTLGYMLIEGWSLADSMYMALTTIATVGFGEVRPLSAAGRLFTAGLILLGVGVLSYTFSMTAALIFEGQWTRRWEQRRMEQRVRAMQGHYIVCGYGRVGRQIARDLRRERIELVVIDVNQASLDQAARDGLSIVYGNATEDEILREAGIERASGLITAIADDADNIFVTLSARALQPKIPIVARANFDDAVHKLRRAGATHVVSPYAMAGQQMALLAVRPAAVDFVETLLRGTNDDLLIEDLRIAPAAPLAGLRVSQARADVIRGATLLALRREGRLLAPPAEDMILDAGDIIVVAGADSQLRAIEAACSNVAGV